MVLLQLCLVRSVTVVDRSARRRPPRPTGDAVRAVRRERQWVVPKPSATKGQRAPSKGQRVCAYLSLSLLRAKGGQGGQNMLGFFLQPKDAKVSRVWTFGAGLGVP